MSENRKKPTDRIKCKIEVTKIFFPKVKDQELGDWVSFGAEVIEVIEGEPWFKSQYSTSIQCIGTRAPLLSIGERYTLHGTRKDSDNEKYGPSYEIDNMYTKYDFSDVDEQKIFLKFVLSNSQINRLYEHFENPFKIIENRDIKKLMEIKGVGESTAMKIIEKVSANVDNGRVYIELEKYGMTKKTIDKLVASFGASNLLEKFHQNPYFLMFEADGFGWKKTDQCALKFGIQEGDIRRVKAFIYYIFIQREQEGHTYITINELLDKIREEISAVENQTIREAFHELKEEEVLWWDDTKTRIGLVRSYLLEYEITKELNRLIEAPSELFYKDAEETLKEIEEENGFEFTEEQHQAVLKLLNTNVGILTGYSGVGKTTTVSALLACCDEPDFVQTALAGRAAARMKEITGEDGYTIHRLLGQTYKREDIDELGNDIDGNPVKDDSIGKLANNLIILDEISMVGGDIFLSLLRGIRSGSKLIMIGDVGQLESIGTLNLFRDLINSGKIPTAHLTKIHRQAEKSAIITTSASVRNQSQIFNSGFSGIETRGDLQDFTMDIYDDAELTQRKIIKHFKNLMSQGIPADDIQVIVPMKTRGESSTFVLNNLLTNIVNPNGEYVRDIFVSSDNDEISKIPLKVNDRVINNKNNYKLKSYRTGKIIPIFNGNLGKVVCACDEGIVIDFFDIGEIVVEYRHMSNLSLAYAITGHKLQGSECPHAIVGLDMGAYMMLTKEWLYTAITRAKETCTLCGQNMAIRRAIDTSRIPYKQTLLKEMLNGESFFNVETLKSMTTYNKSLTIW